MLLQLSKFVNVKLFAFPELAFDKPHSHVILLQGFPVEIIEADHQRRGGQAHFVQHSNGFPPDTLGNDSADNALDDLLRKPLARVPRQVGERRSSNQPEIQNW
jgi:hypothetical protein